MMNTTPAQTNVSTAVGFRLTAPRDHDRRLARSR